MSDVTKINAKQHLDTLFFIGPKEMVAGSTDTLSKTAEVGASAIGVASIFKPLSDGVKNLNNWFTSTADGLGALGIFGTIYDFTHDFKDKSAAHQAKTVFYGVASGIDAYNFAGAIKLIPAITGIAAGALGVFQSAVVVAGSICNLVEQGRLLKNSNKSVKKCAGRIEKWKNRLRSSETSKTSEVARLELLAKYRNKFIESSHNKTPKERQAQEKRWTVYVRELENGSCKSIEANNDYKIAKWTIEKHNNVSQRRRSLFSIIADVIKIAVIIFATIMSFVFPVAGFALSAVIAIACLIKNTVGLTNMMQEILFHKLKKMPKRPELAAMAA